MPKKDEVKSASKGAGESKLTDRQQRFVDEYLVDLNGKQAAIRTGYSEATAEQQASRLLSYVKVQEAIQKAQNKRSERTQITQDTILNRLLENIEISMGKRATIITNIRKNGDTGELVGDDVMQFVYEPASANKALELLGKHLGMFKDRLDVTTAGNPLPTIINVVFGDDPEDN